MNVIIFILAFIGCAYLFFIGVAVVEYFINLEKRVKKNETDIVEQGGLLWTLIFLSLLKRIF